jgi:hypothetical protein
MKTILKIFALIMMVGFWACEKNDPLGDQGELTGNIVPFNLLAQPPDAAAGDTVRLRTVCWAVDDDIESVIFNHMGFKILDFEVKMRVQTADETVELTVNHLADSVLFSSEFIAHYPEEGATMNDYYQTLENAYVILHDFVVPMQYALNRLRNEELIMNMSDVNFTQVVEKFSLLFRRPVMIVVFPEINPFSLIYFKVDDQGFYTGELTEQGVQYVKDNLDRELMIDFLREATVADNTRVTVESVAALEANGGKTSSGRTFRVL